MTKPPPALPTEDPVVENGLLIRICEGPTCGKRYEKLKLAVEKYVEEQQLEDSVVHTRQYCFGRCSLGPNLAVEHWREGKLDERARLALMSNRKHPDISLELGVRSEDIPALIRAHLRAWKRQQAPDP